MITLSKVNFEAFEKMRVEVVHNMVFLGPQLSRAVS